MRCRSACGRYENSAPLEADEVGWNVLAQPSPTYAQQAVGFVAGLAAIYGTNPALIGFELLNDPVVSWCCVRGVELAYLQGCIRLIVALIHLMIMCGSS